MDGHHPADGGVVAATASLGGRGGGVAAAANHAGAAAAAGAGSAGAGAGLAGTHAGLVGAGFGPADAVLADFSASPRDKPLCSDRPEGVPTASRPSSREDNTEIRRTPPLRPDLGPSLDRKGTTTQSCLDDAPRAAPSTRLRPHTYVPSGNGATRLSSAIHK